MGLENWGKLIFNLLPMRMGGVCENIQSFSKDQVDSSFPNQMSSNHFAMAMFTYSEFFHATCYLAKRYSSL